MLHNGYSSKPETSPTSKASRDPTGNTSSTPSLSANGREGFLCDSSSEVSDEGYKSSQGGCSSSFLTNKDKLVVENGRGFKDKTSISKDSSSPNSSSADIALSTSSHEGRTYIFPYISQFLRISLNYVTYTSCDHKHIHFDLQIVPCLVLPLHQNAAQPFQVKKKSIKILKSKMLWRLVLIETDIRLRHLHYQI